jgi:hypothetical protein
MDVTLPEGSDREDSLVALVLWRLHDPAWNPSFADLLEDARTCADPVTEAATLLAALRNVVTSDPALAPRARTLAVQAQALMAARGRSRGGGSETAPRPPRRQLRALRAPLFRI